MIVEIETPVGEPRDEDMRASILRAAGALFAERGYNATSVREVVELAGCKKPTLYYYFANKETLFLEVIRQSCTTIDQEIDAALDAPHGSVRAHLTAGLHTYLAYVRANPTALKLLMTAERHPEEGQPFFDFDALRQARVESTRAMLEAGVASGELRSGFDFDEAVLALFGMVDHRLILFLHGRPIPDDYPERLLDLFFEGVGA